MHSRDSFDECSVTKKPLPTGHPSSRISQLGTSSEFLLETALANRSSRLTRAECCVAPLTSASTGRTSSDESPFFEDVMIACLGLLKTPRFLTTLHHHA